MSIRRQFSCYFIILFIFCDSTYQDGVVHDTFEVLQKCRACVDKGVYCLY